MDFNGFSMDFNGFSMDFNGFQWISMDFNGFQWIFNGFSMDFNGFSMDFNGFQWISMDFQWISMDFQWIFNGFQWIFNGFQWISMDFNGFQWISMDFNGFQWISMDFNGFSMDFQWIFSGFQWIFNGFQANKEGLMRIWTLCEEKQDSGNHRWTMVSWLDTFCGDGSNTYNLQFWGWPAIDAMHGKKLSVNTFCWGWNLSSCAKSSNFGLAHPSHFAGAWHEVKCLAWALSIAQHRPDVEDKSLDPNQVLPGNLQVKPRCWPCETKNSAVRDAI